MPLLCDSFLLPGCVRVEIFCSSQHFNIMVVKSCGMPDLILFKVIFNFWHGWFEMGSSIGSGQLVLPGQLPCCWAAVVAERCFQMSISSALDEASGNS